VVPDSAEEKALLEAETDKEAVYLKITAVKPLLEDGDNPEQDVKLELGVSRFFFSTPFTAKVSSALRT
jgi:predicted secreted hydrolase